MSDKRTTKRTLESRRTGRTDWTRVDKLTDKEIEANAASDEENGQWTEEQLKAARLVLPEDRAKVPVYIRLDPEVIEYFKSQGPRYQTRINAVLRSYVRSVRASGKKPAREQ